MTGNQVVIHVREQGTAQTQSALSGLKGSAVAGAAAITAAFAGVVVATRAVAGAVSASVAAYAESERAGVKLDAIIKATGNTLVRTRADFENYASTMQRATGVSDEAITDMQGILLTFKEIGQDVFDRTAEAALDMSAVFGQDLQSSAVQLGKALQDPIVGMTALRRIGISFSESQQEAVKQFAATNDILGAQKLILKEVEAQVGGTARAMGETASGKADRFRNAINDLQESLGGAVIRGFTPLIDSALKWAESADAIEFTNAMERATSELAKALIAAADAGGAFVGFLGDLKKNQSDTGWITDLARSLSGIGAAQAIGDLWGTLANTLPASIVGAEQARSRGAGEQSQGRPAGGWGVVNEEAAAAQAAFIQAERSMKAAVGSSWGGGGDAKKSALVSAWESLQDTLNKELTDSWVKGGQGRMEAVQAEQAKLTANVQQTAQRMSEALGIPLADAILPAFQSIRDAEQEMSAARVKAATESFDAIEKVMRAEEELAKKRAQDAFELTKSLWASFGGGGSAGAANNLAALANAAANGGAAFGTTQSTDANGNQVFSSAPLAGVIYGDQVNVFPNVSNGGTPVPSTADGFSE